MRNTPQARSATVATLRFFRRAAPRIEKDELVKCFFDSLRSILPKAREVNARPAIKQSEPPPKKMPGLAASPLNSAQATIAMARIEATQATTLALKRRRHMAEGRVPRVPDFSPLDLAWDSRNSSLDSPASNARAGWRACLRNTNQIVMTATITAEISPMKSVAGEA